MNKIEILSSSVRTVANEVKNSMRVAPQWHIPAAVFAGISIHEGIRGIKNLKEGRYIQALPAFAVSAACIPVATFCESAANIYHNDYKRMKNMFKKWGWHPLVVRERMDYYCGERASRIAAADSGYTDEYTKLKTRLHQIT